LNEAVTPPFWITVARVVEPWGLEGWIRVRAYGNSKATVLGKARAWRVAGHPGRSSVRRAPETRDLQIVDLRAHADCWLALPEGVDNRDKALELKGREILVRRSDFPRTNRGEYYWVDLIGCEVVNRAGEMLGKVEKLEDHGAHPLLCVSETAAPESTSTTNIAATALSHASAEAASAPKFFLIPFVRHFVDRVDLETTRIHVDWQRDWS
jgi:16S rRNA processing protein RimM